MSKDKFFKDSLLLTLSNLATGILGFMFSIILSRELGPEGMGLYGLVMPIYNLFICLICGGMLTAISKVAAVFFSKSDFKNLNKSIEVSLGFDIIWSLIVVSIFFLAAPYISTTIIKDPRTLASLKVICPALVLVALSSILKGYFYGVSKIKIPAFIDILEKALRISIISTVVNMLSHPSLSTTVTIAYASLCIGEFSSFTLLYIFYKINKRGNYNAYQKSEGRAQLLFDVLTISFPLCLNGFLTTALSTISTLIVPRRLVSAGLTYSNALSLIGKFSGMALAIIFFPLIVVNSMSLILIPDISQNMSKKDYYAMESRITQVLKVSFLLGICTLAVSLSISDSMGKLFFGRSDLGPYIRFAAFAAPFTYTSGTTFSILNGLGKQGKLLRNSIIVSIEEVVLLYILTGISYINIFGFGITLFITSFTILILNLYEIRKVCYFSFTPMEISLYILLSLLIYFLLVIINSLLPDALFTIKNIVIISLGYTLFFLTASSLGKRFQ